MSTFAVVMARTGDAATGLSDATSGPPTNSYAGVEPKALGVRRDALISGSIGPGHPPLRWHSWGISYFLCAVKV